MWGRSPRRGRGRREESCCRREREGGGGEAGVGARGRAWAGGRDPACGPLLAFFPWLPRLPAHLCRPPLPPTLAGRGAVSQPRRTAARRPVPVGSRAEVSRSSARTALP